MRSTTLLGALCAFAGLTSAQQYAGEVIKTDLPNVPGSEIAFFKIPGIDDKTGKKAVDLTLINYYSHGSDGKRLDESKVQRAVIIIHGLNRDPGTYESNMLSALAQVTGDKNVNKDSVAVMAPYFPNGDDKKTGYPWTDGLSAGKGSTSSALVWKGSQWSAGGNNQYPSTSTSTSSYTVLDTLVKYFDNKALFPNMKQIVVAGHSLGAQTVQRYAALGNQLNTQSPVTYWIGNPNSYVWLSKDRPLPTASCPSYDDYREGYNKFIEYGMTYGQSLVSQGREAIVANFQSKQIAYARGTQDNGDDSSSCAPGTTGVNRNERFFNFIKAFPASCTDPTGRNCDTVDFVNMGHDGGGMMASEAGRARLFTDNFYGNGNRSYDFGYPRQQDGDDPFPDPTLNTTTSSVNNNTYAGNLTYAGCWSDSAASRSLGNQIWDQSSNTIELCTDTCVSRGFTIAGLQFGGQCYCGNSMANGAVKVIETSCNTPCPGNSTEICGGNSRLSIYSNGKPYVNAPASSPETIGKFYYSNCYTDSTTRTLNGKSTSGSYMTLDYCADFCSGYKYFGTEYGSECYCGNTIQPTGSIAPAAECGMTCANNTLQFCGAGNRLNLYTNPDWVQPTGSSTSSSAPAPTAGANGPSCPASDKTTVTSNGLNFTIECGFDHAGGDLTSVYVSSFQECIDACAKNNQCVDVSLSGSACYLKKVLGAAVNAPAIWGAKLVTDVSSSSSSSAVSSSTISTASQSGSSSTTSGSASSTSSSSATSTPSAITCPASNATTYTATSGREFVIECGVDHQAGDMGSKYVDTFQQCIDACDQTVGCVDVSLSGAACYLKKSLGAAVSAPAIWGARLASPLSSSSSSSIATSSATASSSGTSTSAESSAASLTSSTTTSSTSASATASTVSCPGSNDSTVTLASGKSYLIECGIDHQAGDLTSKQANSFIECIAACDTTTGCVDVSFVGDQCYMKSSVGPAVKLDYVWGAKFVAASSSSSSSSVSSVSSVSTTSTSESSSSMTDVSSSSTTDASSASTSDVSSTTTDASSLSTSDVSSTTTDASSSTTDNSSTSTSDTSSSTSSDLSVTTSSSTTTSEASTTESTSTAASETSSDLSSSSSLVSSSTTSSEVLTTSSSTTESELSASTETSSASSESSSTTSSEATSSIVESTSSSTTSAASTPSTTSSTSESQTSSESSTSSVLTTSSELSTVSDSSSTTSSATTSSATETTSSTASLSSQASSESSTSTSSTSAETSSTTSSETTTSTTSSSSSASSSTSSSLSSSSEASSQSSTTMMTSVVPSSAASSTAAPTASSAALPSGLSYAGCFVDSSSARALPFNAGTSSTQTQQQCAMTCQARGYKYSGTEYANECWCGSSAPTIKAPESDCKMSCKGDSTQKCGAGARLSVVSDDSWKQTFFARESFESWGLFGCYTDSTAKRSLGSSVSLAAYGGGANATVSNCLQACQAKGFKYCGAEYYAECFGSNAAPATSLASGADPLVAGCNYPCKGNSTESCGGSNRIIVYGR